MYLLYDVSFIIQLNTEYIHEYACAKFLQVFSAERPMITKRPKNIYLTVLDLFTFFIFAVLFYKQKCAF